MIPKQTGSRFKTTSWTIVHGAPQDAAALAEFIGEYWSPIYAFIRRTGRSREDAADLTQAYFSSLLQNTSLLETADPDRGRFRTLLLTALKNFLVDEHRREHGRDGYKSRMLPIEPGALHEIEPSVSDDPTSAFDRQWATTVLNAALDRVEATCINEGLAAQWRVFEQRVLRPAGHGTAPAPIDEMMAELGATTAQEVYSMVQTMKRRLQRELLAVVRETVCDPSEAEQELAELLQALAKPR